MKAKYFLQLNKDQQLNYIQSRRISNHFILQIYPHVEKEVRDMIISRQQIKKKTFALLPKDDMDMKTFCQLQEIVTDIEFVREWKDILDWEAISRRGDFSIEFIREFKKNINWKTFTEWNNAGDDFRVNSIYYKNEFQKEFGDYCVRS